MLYKRCGILDSGTSHRTRSILCRPISPACCQTGRAGRFGSVEQFRLEDGQALDCKGYPSERQGEIRYAGGLKRAQVKGFAPAVAELIWVQVRVAQARFDPRGVEP